MDCLFHLIVTTILREDQGCIKLSPQKTRLKLRRLMHLPGLFSWFSNILGLTHPNPELFPITWNISVALPCVLEHAQRICPYPIQAHLPTQKIQVYSDQACLCINVSKFYLLVTISSRLKTITTVLCSSSHQKVEFVSPFLNLGWSCDLRWR